MVNFEYSEIIRIQNISKGEEKVTVYPVPATNFLNVELQVNDKKEVQASLLNSNGKLIRDNVIKESLIEGQYKYVIDIEDLTTGMYFVRIRLNNNTYTKKILILN